MATTCLQNGTKSFAPSATGFTGLALQRKCACGGSAGVMNECHDCSSPKLSTQRTGHGAAKELAGRADIVDDTLQSSGEPLDEQTRSFFEARFGHDFSRVRLHAGPSADKSARALNSLAYTSGNDIAFRSNHYRPDTQSGRALIAHELTHVIQQKGESVSPRTNQAQNPANEGMLSQAIAEAASEPLEAVSGIMVQRQPQPGGNTSDAFPVVNTELVLDTSKPQRCCSCGTPPCVSHVGAAQPGDPTAQNGMNLVATLLHTIESSSRSLDYGFVQTMQTRRCLEFLPAQGGGWTVVDNQPAGTNDVFGACATCTTPVIREGLPEIVYADAPGLALSGTNIGAHAFGNQLVQRANFATWVIAREGTRPWQRISEPEKWHSLSWIRRDIAGNWELNPGHNEIGPGWSRFGSSCPP